MNEELLLRDALWERLADVEAIYKALAEIEIAKWIYSLNLNNRKIIDAIKQRADNQPYTNNKEGKQ